MNSTQRTGYSGKPLYQKLGLKEEQNITVLNAPTDYESWLEAPFSVDTHDPKALFDVIHMFSDDRGELRSMLTDYLPRLQQNGMIWVSWPKKASKVPTNVTEDVVRAEVFPLGLVDVKVCSVNPVWSGLKVVIRKENRK